MGFLEGPYRSEQDVTNIFGHPTLASLGDREVFQYVS